MKKITIFALCLAIVMTLCSCGKDSATTDNEKNNVTKIPTQSVQGDSDSLNPTEEKTPDTTVTPTETPTKAPTKTPTAPTNNRVACGICGGTGWQWIPNAYYDAALNMWMGQNQVCSGCGGAGYINTGSAPDTKNEFNKAWSRDYLEKDRWTIYLGHAHWEGNNLVISFYITNGFDHDITLNISEIVEIKDSKGNVIARDQLNFNNYEVKFEEYNTTTITFSGSAILMPGANLNDDGLDIWMVN